MDASAEFSSFCANIPNDRWRVSLTGQKMLNNKMERVSRLSLTAVTANSLARLTFWPVWISGLRKGQGGAMMEAPSAASPGWYAARVALWVNTLAGCDRCARLRCLSSQQLHGWLLRSAPDGQTLTAHQRFPVFPLCLAWRNPKSVASVKIRD